MLTQLISLLGLTQPSQPSDVAAEPEDADLFAEVFSQFGKQSDNPMQDDVAPDVQAAQVEDVEDAQDNGLIAQDVDPEGAIAQDSELEEWLSALQAAQKKADQPDRIATNTVEATADAKRDMPVDDGVQRRVPEHDNTIKSAPVSGSLGAHQDVEKDLEAKVIPSANRQEIGGAAHVHAGSKTAQMPVESAGNNTSGAVVGRKPVNVAQDTAIRAEQPLDIPVLGVKELTPWRPGPAITAEKGADIGIGSRTLTASPGSAAQIAHRPPVADSMAGFLDTDKAISALEPEKIIGRDAVLVSGQVQKGISASSAAAAKDPEMTVPKPLQDGSLSLIAAAKNETPVKSTNVESGIDIRFDTEREVNLRPTPKQVRAGVRSSGHVVDGGAPKQHIDISPPGTLGQPNELSRGNNDILSRNRPPIGAVPQMAQPATDGSDHMANLHVQGQTNLANHASKSDVPRAMTLGDEVLKPQIAESATPASPALSRQTSSRDIRFAQQPNPDISKMATDMRVSVHGTTAPPAQSGSELDGQKLATDVPKVAQNVPAMGRSQDTVVGDKIFVPIDRSASRLPPSLVSANEPDVPRRARLMPANGTGAEGRPQPVAPDASPARGAAPQELEDLAAPGSTTHTAPRRQAGQHPASVPIAHEPAMQGHVASSHVAQRSAVSSDRQATRAAPRTDRFDAAPLTDGAVRDAEPQSHIWRATAPSAPSATAGAAVPGAPASQFELASITAPGIVDPSDEPEMFASLSPSEVRPNTGPTTLNPLQTTYRADTAQVMRQISENIPRLADGGVDIRLSPEELGNVRFQMAPSENGMTVLVQADRPETLDLLRRNIDQLARDLADAGFEGASFDFGDGQGDSHPDKSPDRAVTAPIVEETAPVLSELPAATGGIDIRI